MTKVRCNTCVGSGKVMGGGMMQQDCDECDGRGKIFVNEEPKFEIDKNSKHYKEAIRNIKNLHEGITNEKAEEIFEDELKKINLKDEKPNAKSIESKDNRQK